ncbi:dethiobiotin synthase [Avibacterium paragallinarum]|uniref:ATP-dependent dethiobiotin synthetase BioD n=1 Tax=Avibacterium paragallinarum TaxID=728 RepID=A0A380X2A1_AVIPA|nr:dethiobiotin synthase [Avibacterium paragallinarum]SUU97385.1 ATP-dependent dethiobiotin synthetase BioD 1 [Avibacterium paragallinarum]
MSCFFVTGTDTNVGKTVASRAIIQALQNEGIQIVGYKPIACRQEDWGYQEAPNLTESDYGLENNSDVLTLMSATKESVTYQDVNSYSFSHKLPMLSEEGQRIDIAKINYDLMALSQRFQSVLVEGAFGWLTPMNQEYSFASWAVSHKMPVVLVVGIKEGCINHALLTAQSIEQSGLPLLGWIANRINPGLAHYAEIIAMLSEKIEAPLLGQIPYVHKPEEQELGHYITNLERLTYIQTTLVK